MKTTKFIIFNMELIYKRKEIMKKILLLLVVIIVSLLSCSSKDDFVKAAKSTKSVVLVNVYALDSCQEKVFSNYGSGVVVLEDGYIVTCNHVTKNADSIVVIAGGNSMTAKLVGANLRLDISVLKVNKNLKPIKIGNSDNIQTGQNVLNIGYPIYLGITVNSGIISGRLDGSKFGLLNLNYIQTDAALNQGNSGGALTDDKGRLIGINNMIISPTGFYVGYSFAVPINEVMKYVEELTKKD